MEPNLTEIFGSFMPWKLDDKTWILQFMNGSEYMYLLEGDEKALLIDTGWGTGNVRELVEHLTDKPITVVNTHFHPDHAGGNGEFEEVYVSSRWEMDAPSLEPSGVFVIDISKLPHPDYKKIPIKEGYVFDLGGRKVEVFDAKPAHCNSSIYLLDRDHRMLFTGDEIESAQTNLFNDPKNEDGSVIDGVQVLKNFRDNVARMWDLRDAYDYVLPNHNGTPIAKEYIRDYNELYDAILEDRVTVEEKLNHKYIEMDPVAPELVRVRHANISIFIRRKDLAKAQGK